MFAQVEYPEKLQPEELDTYLAKGWFRMRQTIFTTNFLYFNQRFYSAIWLRVALENGIRDKKFFTLSKLIKKADGAISGEAHELLYQYYRQSISFEVSPTLQELLIGNLRFNRFDTHVVNIYDGATLIAAGFFDLGKKSAAGITCIYHPAYKKYSLGKYLMYLKMDFCKQQQMEYFYPGYVVPGYGSFDYKLEIGKSTLQYLQLSSRQWLPWIPKISAPDPLREMVDRLSMLKANLAKNSVPNAILYYKFFEANLDPYYYGNELFDFPVFLYCIPPAKSALYNMIVYDVRIASYRLIQCSSVINIGFHDGTQPIFDSDLLSVERQLFTTPIPATMEHFLYSYLKN